MLVKFNTKSLDLSQPQIMGVLNTTPDSFYDGGQFYVDGKLNVANALAHVDAMVAAGASFLDIGGESTRPGAARVSVQEEMDRVLPLVEAVVGNLDVIVSVDTSSPALMREAITLGAGLINDVRALQREGALEVVAKSDIPVCLMHMQGMPQTMQHNPEYQDVVGEVRQFLEARIALCEAAGIDRSRILVDPGFGFGKTDEHNITLLRHLESFTSLGPVLVGLSRKSMIGRLLDRDVEQRLAGSLALAILAVQRGASIVRVHDVRETADALKLNQIITKKVAKRS